MEEKKVYIVVSTNDKSPSTPSSTILDGLFGIGLNNEIFGVFDNLDECERFVNEQNAIASVRGNKLLAITECTLNYQVKSYKEVKWLRFIGSVRTDDGYKNAEYKIDDLDDRDHVECGCNSEDGIKWAVKDSKIWFESGRDYDHIKYSIVLSANHPLFKTSDRLARGVWFVLYAIRFALNDIGLWKSISERDVATLFKSDFYANNESSGVLSYGHRMTPDTFDKVMRRAIEIFDANYNTFLASKDLETVIKVLN